MQRIDSVAKASYPNVVTTVITGGIRVPLANYDKAICFKPDAWQVEVNYLHSLERYIQAHCSSGN